MEIIRNILFIFIVVLTSLSCKEKQAEIFKLRWADYDSTKVVHYYVINHPPKDNLDLIALVDSFYVNANFKDSLKIKNVNFFIQTFYEEGLTVNRNSGPSSIGRGLLFHKFWGSKYYSDVELISVIRSGGTVKELANDFEPVRPYYSIKKKDKKLLYYPNGTKSNPNIRFYIYDPMNPGRP
ncbi:MAG: hypothetical protein KF870_05730 [Leadbetterella sp.]|nr:hypothetical protein [Leadbetterella sp.]